jgi:hypothetical protein
MRLASIGRALRSLAPRHAARAAALGGALAWLAAGHVSDAGQAPRETCDGACTIAAGKEPVPARGTRFSTLPDVRVSPRIADKLARIAEHYHKHTGKTLVVTSGTRDPRDQAEAVYDKLQGGDDIVRLYRNKEAAREIKEAYDRHRQKGRAAAISAMARTIRAQVARGTYISSHLRAGAADIRSHDMSPTERRHFVEGALATKGVSVLYESIPPHFHVQLK